MSTDSISPYSIEEDQVSCYSPFQDPPISLDLNSKSTKGIIFGDFNQAFGEVFNVDSNIKLEYIHAYKMNEEKLTLLSKKLNENKLNITFHNQSKITGNIYNDLENQIIFTTIPYDEGWHIKINGKETKAFKNLDSLLAFEIPKGNLEVELSFIPKGYILGLTISFITFDLLVAIYVRKNKEN